MKIRSLILVCCLCLALAVIVVPTPAQSAAAGKSLDFGRVFLNYSETLSNHPWWQSHIVTDAKGGVHLTFYTDVSVYYAYCAGNCGSKASWGTPTVIAPVGGYDSLTYPSVAVNAAGQPRLMWYDGNGYTYAECSGSCRQASSWKKVSVDPCSGSYCTNYPRNARYFALDSQGRPRFVTIYYAGVTFATCDSACTSASNWNFSDLDLGGGLTGPELVFNPTGQPRIAGIDTSDDAHPNKLMYTQCNQNCSDSQNWAAVRIADSVGKIFDDPNYALRLDAQGRPRLAYYHNDNADDEMFYAWSNANFTDPASWTTDHFTLAPGDSRTLDLAIDSLGRPHIVFGSSNFDLRYLRCDTQCNTLQSAWTIQDVETGDELDASNYLPPSPGAWGTSWWVLGYTTLALDKNNTPYISYYVQNVDYINTSTYPKAWGIRVASAVSYPYAIFLPLTRK